MLHSSCPWIKWNRQLFLIREDWLPISTLLVSSRSSPVSVQTGSSLSHQPPPTMPEWPRTASSSVPGISKPPRRNVPSWSDGPPPPNQALMWPWQGELICSLIRNCQINLTKLNLALVLDVSKWKAFKLHKLLWNVLNWLVGLNFSLLLF